MHRINMRLLGSGLRVCASFVELFWLLHIIAFTGIKKKY